MKANVAESWSLETGSVALTTHLKPSPRSMKQKKARVEFGGGWAVVTEIHSLTATKAGQNCYGRRKRPVKFSKP